MRKGYDQYFTPKKLAKILTLYLPENLGLVLEPCNGLGYISDVLKDRASVIYTNDIDTKFRAGYHEDATNKTSQIYQGMYDWVVTNPPYNNALPILKNCWRVVDKGMAALVRLSFLEPANVRAKRGEFLEKLQPFMSNLLIFGSPRPDFTGGGGDSVTTCWVVWRKDNLGKNCKVNFIYNWKEFEL